MRMQTLKTFTLSVLLALSGMALSQPQAMAKVFYISPGGDGTTGNTWGKAWKSPGQIDWNAVNAGDQLVLDGGTAGITYETELLVPKSGQPGAPITIRQSNQTGHNGQVLLYGAATGSPNPRPPLPGLSNGIKIQGSYINVVAARRGGIKIKSYNESCVNIVPGNSHINLRNLELENRVYLGPYGLIQCTGLNFAGFNIQVAACDFRECQTAAKEIAVAGANNMAVFRDCTFGSTRHYLNFTRGCGTAILGANPQVPGAVTNYNSTVYAHRCAFGPHVTAGIIHYKGNLRVSDSLFLAPPQYGVSCQPAVATAGSAANANVRINHCSFITPSQPGTPPYGMLGFPIESNGNGLLKVANSVVYGGTIRVPVTQNINGGGNFQFRVFGNTTALSASQVDPQFQDEAAVAAMPSNYEPYQFALLNYSIMPGSPAVDKGSRLTSVNQLTTPYGPKGPILPLGGP